MENGRWDAYTVDGTTFGRRVGIAERGREREKNKSRDREKYGAGIQARRNTI